ncbi:hypothetical protein DSM43518_02283 [Mycobacterium marinum]|nr:hypothetical protein DSM43518_02283 [Mycobacterium marinum]
MARTGEMVCPRVGLGRAWVCVKGADMRLTRAQIDEIQQRLDEGMSPEAIADSIGRLADLEDLDIVMIRSAAYDLRNGEPVRAVDD